MKTMSFLVTLNSLITNFMLLSLGKHKGGVQKNVEPKVYIEKVLAQCIFLVEFVTLYFKLMLTLLLFCFS